MRTRNIVGGVIIAVIILAFLVQALNPLPPRKFTISTGGPEGAYYAFGLDYKALIAEQSLNLEVTNSAGSVENIERLRNGETDIAIVQGGVMDSKDAQGLQSLGSLFYEPVWLFYKKDLDIRRITQLEGRRIGIGVEGSGTRPLALQLLEINGITEGNATLVGAGLSEMTDMMLNGDLDAVFMVVSPKAEVVQRLAVGDNIEIFNFTRAEAYRSHFTYMNSIELGQGVLNLVENIPTQSKTLLAVTANLVVREDINPNLARLFISTSDRVHSGPGIFEAPGEFPSAAYITAPLHDESRRYFNEGASWFENNFPFMLAAIFDRLVVILLPLLTLFYPLVSGAMPLYHMSMDRRITRWYNTLNEIDRNIATKTLKDVERDLMRLDNIEEELRYKTKLPISYMPRFYDLLEHIGLVRTHVEERREEILAEQGEKSVPATA
jgi:uncharacterized protein